MTARWGLLGVSAIALLAADTPKPFGIEKRVQWTTSHLVGSPDPPQSTGWFVPLGKLDIPGLNQRTNGGGARHFTAFRIDR